MSSSSAVQKNKKLYVILDQASLEVIRTGHGTFELLNCEKHMSDIRKHNRSLTDCRPDITHQCLMMLLDSPLNKAGHLEIFVHSSRNVLLKIHPSTRIPRTFNRFAALMVQVLNKFVVRSTDGGEKLLQVIKNPVTDHLPLGIRCISTSYHSDNVVKASELAASTSDFENIAIVIGAMARGSVDVDYTEKTVSISNYPLSAALTCSKICTAFEDAWDIF